MTKDRDENTQEIIRVKDLFKCFWTGKVAHPALNGVNCAIRKGEFVVLAGRSGSGKSTLLSIMGGLELPDKGSVSICGKNVLQGSKDQRALFRLRHLGFIFQAFNLIQVLTARENIAYVCQLQGHSREACFRNADRWLHEVELSELGERRPDQLSGGEQQRVAVARALAMTPEIVLADEPTANLDSNTARNLIALMRRLNQQYGTTFVIASHDPVLIDSADRVIAMEDGRVIVDGEPVEPLPVDLAKICPSKPASLSQRLFPWRNRAENG